MIKNIMEENQNIRPAFLVTDKLRQAVPQCFDAQGNFKIDMLQTLLQNEVKFTKEGYDLNFLGKNYARLLAALETATVIEPDAEHNTKAENAASENIYITGDNLDALKHLLKSYEGKIKCIYIDPPYNTGSDGFVYNDKFAFTAEKLMEKLSIDEDEAKRILDMTSRGASSHSAWLAFMYPRLLLARDLLSDDGVIFISIDDNEQANLKLLCDSIFGEENFVANAPRKTGAGSAATNSDSELRKLNDYVCIYLRSHKGAFKKKAVGEKKYEYEDEFGKYTLVPLQATGSDATRIARPNMYYPIYVTTDNSITTDKSCSNILKAFFPKPINNQDGRWIWKADTFEERKDRFVIFDGINFFRKKYCNEIEDQTKYQVEKAWFDIYTNAQGTRELDGLFSIKKVFEHPKPVGLLEMLIGMASNESDFVVLDFFSGSATTAQAVMQLNAEDNGKRKFIMVQLPEKLDKESIAFKNLNYKTIDEIGRERIKRAAAKIKTEYPATNADLGYKHYTLRDVKEDTLLTMEDFDPQQALVGDETLLQQFGVPTVLATWLVHDSYGFNAPVQEIDLAGYKAYRCGEHLYLLADGFGEEALQALFEAYDKDLCFGVKKLVLFGYSFSWSARSMLEDNLKKLKSLENNTVVNVEVRY